MIKKMILALMAFGFVSQAHAAKDMRILYLEVDQGPRLLERDHAAFRRIYDHTGNYLDYQNIRLFEEKTPSRELRSQKEALDIASRVKRRSLDAVVTVAVRHNVDHDGNRSRDQMVAIARIFDGRSLQLIDTVRVKSPAARIHEERCHGRCQDMIMRRHVREVLSPFKDKLADRLMRINKHLVQKRAPVETAKELTLTLKGFQTREVRHIENRLVQLDGTRDLSSLKSGENKKAFWLERKAQAPDIKTEMNEMLAELDLKARIIQTERHVTLIKIPRDVVYNY